VKQQSAETVVQLMVAKDPRQSAEIILGFLMGVNGAGAGAIFSLHDGVALFVGHGIGQDVLEWTTSTWARDAKRLQEGRLSRTDARFLVPVLRHERLVALVYLAASELDLGSIGEVASLVGDAVIRSVRQPPAQSAVETFLEHTSAREIARRKLVLLLDRHEWNVARVARELQVTRTTVYKRLETFGIERKRISKGGGGRSPLPAPS
jgi:hypothetical protein